VHHIYLIQFNIYLYTSKVYSIYFILLYNTLIFMKIIKNFIKILIYHIHLIEMFCQEINLRFISRLNNEIKIFDFYLVVSINLIHYTPIFRKIIKNFIKNKKIFIFDKYFLHKRIYTPIFMKIIKNFIKNEKLFIFDK